MWYILIHFAGDYVNGFICPGNGTKEEAIQTVKESLEKSIKLLRNKQIGAGPLNDSIYVNGIKRQKEFLESFKNPTGLSPKGSPLVKIQRVDVPLQAGYWLDDVVTMEHVCNKHCTSTS